MASGLLLRQFEGKRLVTFDLITTDRGKMRRFLYNIIGTHDNWMMKTALNLSVLLFPLELEIKTCQHFVEIIFLIA